MEVAAFIEKMKIVSSQQRCMRFHASPALMVSSKL
jgi:hypothetical protein